MKSLIKSLPVWFLLLSSCSSYYNHIIESDYSYDGRFNKYSSYNFVANPNFSGTIEQKDQIEKFMSERLDFWGYQRSEDKPSLLILYNLYLDDGKFKGFNQPDFEYWIRNNYSSEIVAQENDSLNSRSDYVTLLNDGEYKSVRYEMNDGTLLISMFDTKKKKSIWQGYASGVFSDGGSINNERVMRHLVSRIMYEYRVLAFKSL